MEVKLCLVFALLAMTIMAEAYSFSEPSWGLNHFNHVVSSGNHVGNYIGDENENLLDSEASRRALASGRSYIGYGALKANSVPCGRRGQSYYDCQKRHRANPYQRGCNAITHCARYTG